MSLDPKRNSFLILPQLTGASIPSVLLLSSLMLSFLVPSSALADPIEPHPQKAIGGIKDGVPKETVTVGARGVPGPVSRDGVTFRFVEFGEFALSPLQGAEIEIMNSSGDAVVCELAMVLQRQETVGSENAKQKKYKVTQQVHIPELTLAPHSRRGSRVVEPLTYGEYVLDYEVKLNGQPWIKGRASIVAGGPYRMSLRPSYLGNDGIFITVEALNRKAAQFRLSLLEIGTEKVLFKTEDFSPLADEKAMRDEPKRMLFGSFVSFKDQRPGEYLLRLEVLSSQDGTTNKVGEQLLTALPDSKRAWSGRLK